MSQYSIQDRTGWIERTDFAVEESLFHLSHKIDLIQHLQPVGRGDLPPDVEPGIAELFCRDAVAIFQFTQDVNEEL